jgi:uncharacterized protein (TIGR03435 family)
VLTEAKGGSKLAPPLDSFQFSWHADRRGIHLKQRANIDDFASFLSTQLQRPVLNETMLRGVFAIQLDFAPEELFARRSERGDLDPALPQALEQQLGLKIQSVKRTVEFLVVDCIDRTPVEN